MDGKSHGTVKIAASALTLCSYLQELNGTLPKTIEPTFAAFVFMKARMLEANSTILADSREMYDLNMDGCFGSCRQNIRQQRTLEANDTAIRD